MISELKVKKLQKSSLPSVCAVIITYHPDHALLEQLFSACVEQVAALVIVDNGSTAQEIALIHALVSSRYDQTASLVELGDNVGLAAAQNKGIAWAREHRCSQVIFFDQDSIPSASMVRVLQEALADLMGQGIAVAGIGPQLIDRRTGKSTPFVTINWFGVSRKHCEQKKQTHKTDFLVSSGMLVPMYVFDLVGPSEEGLFIDNVDMEWCFRARSLGFSLYGVCDAILQHSVGDQVYRIGPMVLYRHSPVRQYYIMRNRLLLYRRQYTPMAWVLQDALRSLFKVFMFSVVFPPRRKNIRMMCRGVRDALAGKVGRFSE